MTVTTSTQGYLEGPYLEGPYLTTLAQGAAGWQATIVIAAAKNSGQQASLTINAQKASGQQANLIINAQKASGQQANLIINAQKASGQQASLTVVDAQSPYGMQSLLTIVDYTSPHAMQSTLVIDGQKASGQQASLTIVDSQVPYAFQATLVIASGPAAGMQASITVAGANKAEAMQVLVGITDYLKAGGMQSDLQVVGYMAARGFEVRLDKYPTGVCPGEGGYLEADYLAEPYLTPLFCTRPGMQVNILVGEEDPAAMQARLVIEARATYGMQADLTINALRPYGQQAHVTINSDEPYGMQSRVTIVDKLRAYGQQALLRIDALRPAGMQADVVRLTSYAMQSLATIYNTTNLRILCAFPSRGLTSSNWTSNSTLAGDFSVQNLDTDVVEQVWRSNNALTGVRLVTDTGLPQGVFLDTAAILNHNLTKSATVTLLGSNDPTFSVIGIAIPLEARLTNMFYIAPDLPAAGHRYWRFDIDDPTNPETFLEIGTVVFGASEIFQGECFVDEIEFELKDFADTVRTEGFTNVANSRTQKRRLRLDFRSLVFQNRNFTIMREMFQRERTVQKCLWIPTPSATLQDVTARFAVFGKLSVIPTEKHNNKGPNFDYVTFTADVDESL